MLAQFGSNEGDIYKSEDRCWVVKGP